MRRACRPLADIGVRDSAAIVCVRPRNAIHFQAALADESRTVI
jgi:hypothetical protein